MAQELGELVSLHYTHIGRYERGLSRPTANALGVSGDYLMEGATEEAAKARFEDRELLRQFQEVETLPDDDKAVVKKLLDAFLTKKQIQSSPLDRIEAPSQLRVTELAEGPAHQPCTARRRITSVIFGARSNSVSGPTKKCSALNSGKPCSK